MKIALTGATGLLGIPLCRDLSKQGHDLLVFSRNPERVPQQIGVPCEAKKLNAQLTPSAFKGISAIINLAGEPIAQGRWTKEKKARIYSSRIEVTQSLIKAVELLPKPERPRTFISASATGIYGDRGDRPLVEADDSKDENDFLVHVCTQWEKASLGHGMKTIRSVALRFGIILASEGGALPLLKKLFQTNLAGPIAGGHQWMSWIHIADVLSAIKFVLANDHIAGPVNVVSPAPITNNDFTETLAQVLGKKAFFPAPGFAVKLALGEKAQTVLTSQKVVPEKLTKFGFKFQYPDLREALSNLVRG